MHWSEFKVGTLDPFINDVWVGYKLSPYLGTIFISHALLKTQNLLRHAHNDMIGYQVVKQELYCLQKNECPKENPQVFIDSFKK